MKTYFVIEESEGWTMPDGTKKTLTFQYRYFDKALAERVVRLYEREEEHNKMRIEEREEDLSPYTRGDYTRGEYTVYIPKEIHEYGGKEKYAVEYTDKGRVLINGIDVSLEITMDILSIQRYNEYETYRNELWEGRNKHLVYNPVLSSVRFIDEDKIQLIYAFTSNTYLDGREVVGNMCEFKNSEKYADPMTEPFIAIRVYW